jgi:putative acetyltransferase
VIIRGVTEDDHEQILEVVRDAFEGGQEEVRIVNEVRRLDAVVRRLELVGDQDGVVVGHVLTSSADLGGHAVPAVAPLAVRPNWQGRGVGTALMGELIDRAERDRWSLLALLGNPAYYRRFGFEPARPLGIFYPPVDGPAFQVRRLGAYDPGLGGEFRYAWETAPT